MDANQSSKLLFYLEIWYKSLHIYLSIVLTVVNQSERGKITII